MPNGRPFNTDYWTFSNQFMAGAPQVTMDSPGDTSNVGGLPAMWWLGGLIILVVIRIAYEYMD